NAATATAGVACPRILVGWRATPAGAELRVTDNGAGFAGPPRDLFSPFAGGELPKVGLGLAIAQRIAANHGFSSDAGRDGEQTSFALVVPAASLPAAAGN